MKLSDYGLALLKKWEGYRPTAYKDDHGKTKAIEYSIGYGHQILPTELHLLKATINENVASVMLKSDVTKAEKYVSQFGSFTQNQFDALVLLAYNVGSFQSGLIGLLKAKNFKAVPAKIKEYIKAGDRIVPALVDRRNTEAALFVSSTSGIPVFGILAMVLAFFLFK